MRERERREREEREREKESLLSKRLGPEREERERERKTRCFLNSWALVGLARENIVRQRVKEKT